MYTWWTGGGIQKSCLILQNELWRNHLLQKWKSSERWWTTLEGKGRLNGPCLSWDRMLMWWRRSSTGISTATAGWTETPTQGLYTKSLPHLHRLHHLPNRNWQDRTGMVLIQPHWRTFRHELSIWGHVESISIRFKTRLWLGQSKIFIMFF